MLRTKNNVLPVVINTPKGKRETWIRVSNRWGSAVRLKPKVGKWLLTREFSGKPFSGKALECCKCLAIEANMEQWILFEVAAGLLGLSSLSKLTEFIEAELSCCEDWDEEFLNKAYNLVDDLYEAAYDKKFGV
jgi:hypothetical protein